MKIASFSIKGGEVTINHLGGKRYSAVLVESNRVCPSAVGIAEKAYAAVLDLTTQQFARPFGHAIEQGAKGLPQSLAY